MKRKPYIGVIRVDETYDSSPGWLARITRRRVEVRQYFYDRDYGGWRASMAAAIAWRKKMERSLPEPLERAGRANTEPGTVWRERREIWDPNRREWYWRDVFHAMLTIDGKRRTKSFSALKYGEDEAERMAWACLRKWRRELKAAA